MAITHYSRVPSFRGVEERPPNFQPMLEDVLLPAVWWMLMCTATSKWVAPTDSLSAALPTPQLSQKTIKLSEWVMKNKTKSEIWRYNYSASFLHKTSVLSSPWEMCKQSVLLACGFYICLTSTEFMKTYLLSFMQYRGKTALIGSSYCNCVYF